MPLLYSIEVEVTKDLKPKEREEYGKENVEKLQKWLYSELVDIWNKAGWITTDFGQVQAVVRGIHFVSPLRPLSDIVVPVAELRQELAKLNSSGIAELPLDDLLILIRSIYRNSGA